jgi:spore coat-associated protein N
MKKILGLTVSALMVMGLVGSGTWAFFNDTETVTGNYFSAGTLDLDVNSSDDPTAVFALSDVVPGDTDNATITLYNAGSITGELDISITAVSNSENTSSNTEFQDLGGAALGASANLSLWLDIDNNDVISAGDLGLLPNGSTYDATAGLQYNSIDAHNNMDVNPAVASMASGDTYKLWAEYYIDTSIGNEIQGDYVTFTIGFVLEQPEAD